jgi:hypothetical protein
LLYVALVGLTLVGLTLQAIEEVKADSSLSKKGTASMYGMVASIPHESLVDDFMVDLMSEIFTA